MTRLAALEQFLRGQSRLWNMATVVFITLIGLMFNYQLTRPQEQADLETSINAREARIAESGRLCTLHGEMLSVMETAAQPLDQIQAVHKYMIDTGMFPDREQVEENYKSAIKAKEKVELLAARLKGIHFSARVHDEQARKYEAIMASELNVLKVIEDFCAAFLTDDIEKFAPQVRGMAGRLSNVRKEHETIDASEQGINLLMEETLKANSTEDKRLEAQAQILTYKKYAHIPAAMFCIGYLILFSRGVNNVRKKSIKVSARPKRGTPGPKKRRVKR